MAERIEKTSQLLQTKFKGFSRVEKAFYVSIAATMIILAISVVFMKTELDDAKQEVNELIRSERLKEIANSKDLQLNNENIRAAE